MTVTPWVYWADDITTRREKDQLIVRGFAHRLPKPGSLDGRDLIGIYARAIKSGASEKGAASRSPHIKFLNANTEEKLIEFIETFGPVHPIAETLTIRPVGYAREIVVREDLQTAERERRTFAAASGLLHEIRKKDASFNKMTTLVELIRLGTNPWLQECRDQAERRKISDPASGRMPLPTDQQPWKWEASSAFRIQEMVVLCRLPPPIPSMEAISDLPSDIVATPEEVARMNEVAKLRIEAFKAADKATLATWEIKATQTIAEPCNEILCTLLNAFPTYLQRWEGITVEFPPSDVQFGILPALYHLLRCDFLSSVHIALCPWKFCLKKWFRQDRKGQIFCSPECERRHRQNQYYLRRKQQKLATSSAVGERKSDPSKKDGESRPKPKRK